MGALYLSLVLLLFYYTNRFGLIPAMLTMFVANVIGNAGITSDLMTWYAPYGLALLLAVAALAIFGFWRSLGQQQLAPLPEGVR